VGEEEDGGFVGLGHASIIVYWPPRPRRRPKVPPM
jgi:hypothetical protein